MAPDHGASAGWLPRRGRPGPAAVRRSPGRPIGALRPPRPPRPGRNRRGKRSRGRKRHLLTDLNGRPIAISVTSDQPHDSRGGRSLLETATPQLTRLTKVFADAADAGLAARAGAELGVTVDIRRRPEGTHWFVPLQPLWRVERTFACTTIRSESTRVPPVTADRSPPDSRMTGADSPVMADWLCRNRRLRHDYEATVTSSQTFVHLGVRRSGRHRAGPGLAPPAGDARSARGPPADAAAPTVRSAHNSSRTNRRSGEDDLFSTALTHHHHDP